MTFSIQFNSFKYPEIILHTLTEFVSIFNNDVHLTRLRSKYSRIILIVSRRSKTYLPSAELNFFT